MIVRLPGSRALAILLAVTACGGKSESTPNQPAAPAGPTVTALDTTITDGVEAAGTAEPVQSATLSTRLMSAVTAVMVREGDKVTAGDVLARLDARDLAAKRSQVDAGLEAAQVMHQDAVTQTERIRALYADSAATRRQLDQVETELARTEAAVTTARAARAELDAVGSYAEIRAPFAGRVTRRMVDPGDFVAPGAPIVEVEDGSRLRIRVTLSAALAARLERGGTVEVDIEGHPTTARVEGLVPAGGGLYRLNALVDNRDGQFLPGSAASVLVPSGSRRAVLIPAEALVRQGDLQGVDLVANGRLERRWLRLGGTYGGRVEVLAGLAGGEKVRLPS